MTQTNNQVSYLRKRRCLIAGGVLLLLVFLLFLILLILVLTVFKPREPETQLLSATVYGISPRLSFPVVKIELNITLDLKLLVHNPNRVSFRHGSGNSVLLYRGTQVGEADTSSGFIPSKGYETLPSRLTLEVDELASDLTDLISDVLSGKVVMETRTNVPGRVTFLGVFKKHAMATSKCQFTIRIPAMKIQNQECKTKAKF